MDWNPIKLTAMHHQHLGLGATMVDDAGWLRPVQYSSPERELAAVRKAGGLCDTSPLGKLYIQGSGVDALVRRVFPDAVPPETNRVAVGTFDGAVGGSAARVAVCRFSNDEIFIVTPPDVANAVAQALNAHLAGCVHIVDMTSSYAAVTIAGPVCHQLLAKLTDLDVALDAFSDLSCAQGQVAEVYAIVLRWDWGDIPNYAVYCGRDFGEYMWEVMLEAGQEYGMAPFGVEALTRLTGGG